MTTVKKPKKESDKIKDVVVKEIVGLNNGNPGDVQSRPNLAIIVIDKLENKPEFIEDLEKEAIRVGIDTHLYKCPIDSDEEEIEAMIACLNEDELIDAIYIETPLPDKYNQDQILSKIKSSKELNYLVESDTDLEMKQAKLFRGSLDNFVARQKEE